MSATSDKMIIDLQLKLETARKLWTEQNGIIKRLKTENEQLIGVLKKLEGIAVRTSRPVSNSDETASNRP